MMRWEGSFLIDMLLDQCLSSTQSWPPKSNGVYLISARPWNNFPTKKCNPLYVGSTTGKSKRFCTRIGDLIADMFGFYDGGTGHHSGGISLYKYCKKHKINPKTLSIGWLKGCRCIRCMENNPYDQLKPEINKKRPPKCTVH